MRYSEKQIEKYLCDRVEKILKGKAYKFTSPGRRAVPDRVCVIPGNVFFVECKATDKYLTEAQERERSRLIELDQWVYAVNSKNKVDIIIDFWKERLSMEGLLC